MIQVDDPPGCIAYDPADIAGSPLSIAQNDPRHGEGEKKEVEGHITLPNRKGPGSVSEAKGGLL